ncbi:hypothetical protein [Nocardiopsis quinghaiensis]|uniref:hypothetical protein n=1 Tax=Nocardiopsis quinghaiensis TaxID=464995 RepID=UPI00123B3651|nr:hypothetical protein [Nocardiopsis quinghaiensis]
MKTKRVMALAMAVAAVAVMNAPAAQAAEAGPTVPLSAAADGKLHVYYDFNLSRHCASWEGYSSHWGKCRNEVSSLWNNGYPGGHDDVRVYWGLNHSGAYRGVHNGVVLNNLRQWTFDANTGRGSGEVLDNNISSHKWISL